MTGQVRCQNFLGFQIENCKYTNMDKYRSNALTQNQLTLGILGLTRVYIILLMFTFKHRLCVLDKGGPTNIHDVCFEQK